MRTAMTLVILVLMPAAAVAERFSIGVGGGPNPSKGLPVLDGTKAATGEVIGKADFGGKRVAAMLHQAGKDGPWVLALKTGANRLSDMFPILRGTIADGFGLSAPVLAFADGRARVPLSAAAREFYGTDSLDVERGVNLITVARPQGDVRKTLDAAGVKLNSVILTGVVLRDFDGDAISEAKKNGQLAKALRRGTMLKASVPGFSVQLPKGIETGAGYVYVTGEPGVGVGFSMTMNKKLFETRLGIRKTDLGTTEASMYASAKGRWHHAFGIRGFHLDEVSMVLSMDAAQRLGIGLKAKMAIRDRFMSVGGKVLLHAVTGAPMGGAFEGSISKLSSNDLWWMLDARSRRGKVRRADLPEFVLKDAYLRVAPGGGDPDLGIKSGFGIRGTLIAFRKTVAKVEGEMDESPKLRLKGHVRAFQLGPVALERAYVDVNMGAVKNPYYVMSGAARIGSSRKSIDISASRTHYSFATSERVGGVYDASERYATRAGIRPSWSYAAYFKNHFTNTLEHNVSRKATAWANRVRADYAKAQRDISKARKDIARLDPQIRKARAQVHAERKAQWDKINRIRNRIGWLNSEIAKRENRINGLRAYVGRLRKAKDKAYKAWKAAVARRKKAKIHQKAKYKAIEAKKWSAYVSAKAKYDAANKNLVKVVKALDPKLNAYRAERTTAQASYKTQSAIYARITRVSVDADPRVAGLISARKTASASLYAAKKVVGAAGASLAAAGNITAYAARNNGKILMVDEASVSGKLDGWIAGSRLHMFLRVRVMGKVKHLRFKASVRDIAKGRVFDRVWSLLK